GQRALAALFLVVFVNLGIMIPSAPGYIGTFQLFAKLALSAFNVSAAIGLSVAILSHAIQYFLVTGIGFVVFAREHLSLAQLVAPPTTSDSFASDPAHK
ncbi:MAG: flippase-like domain-containing protein, partial [Dehalococcoidia bacterium]|nr:flippase-like domain-containing protein [Dehalococcoidia bacterium]